MSTNHMIMIMIDSKLIVRLQCIWWEETYLLIVRLLSFDEEETYSNWNLCHKKKTSIWVVFFFFSLSNPPSPISFRRRRRSYKPKVINYRSTLISLLEIYGGFDLRRVLIVFQLARKCGESWGEEPSMEAYLLR